MPLIVRWLCTCIASDWGIEEWCPSRRQEQYVGWSDCARPGLMYSSAFWPEHSLVGQCIHAPVTRNSHANKYERKQNLRQMKKELPWTPHQGLKHTFLSEGHPAKRNRYGNEESIAGGKEGRLARGYWDLKLRARQFANHLAMSVQVDGEILQLK